MTVWTKSELITALSGELLQYRITDNLEIDEVVIDSRKTPKSGLFLALKGEKNDAHAFLKQAVENGCKALLVHDKSALEKVSNSDFILVKDTFKALYKLAEFSRKRSSAKIIAITGSVGKTSTKEMLKLAFSAIGKTFATPGNLNNHFGVPLCLANFSSDCEFGIFEMGMNHANEIEPLSSLAKPHLAIITNVGPVHIEFFKNEEEIALAKSEIFLGLVEKGSALINRDNQHFNFLKKRAEMLGIASQNIITFGKDFESDYCLKSFQIKTVDSSEVLLKTKNNSKISYQISTSSKTAIFNSVIVAASLDLLTNDVKTGLTQLTHLQDSAGRGKAFEINFADKKITIIDDSYNASVPSMKAGIEHALELKSALHKKRVVAILGDMLELGEKSIELHEEITNYLTQLNIDFAILVGEKMTAATKKLPQKHYKTFSDSSAASLEIQDLIKDNDILYVKGSRGMKMEKIIENLIKEKSAH
ncbi:MAG: UDP-N-acetylmuramoyl-tripeptide--D-alanyl-D-alanine ligase [Proteobacteria bacterium]|nr:UDP-N-acetylmuramoyl-tripeptide--D-alanyl-D-alanine ligase [Pseudomonadota bacterium]